MWCLAKSSPCMVRVIKGIKSRVAETVNFLSAYIILVIRVPRLSNNYVLREMEKLYNI